MNLLPHVCEKRSQHSTYYDYTGSFILDENKMYISFNQVYVQNFSLEERRISLPMTEVIS